MNRPSPAATAPPGRLARRRQQLRATLVVLGLAALALTAWFIVSDRRGLEREALSQATLYARVVEDQMTRALSAAANTLRALSARGTMRRAADEPEPATRLLEQQLVGQPFLRSLALVDEHGTIIASTVDGEAGLRVDLADLGRPSATTTRDIIGPLLPIRELADRAQGRTTAGTGALPMLRAVPMDGDAPPLWLVALVNPGYFANQHALITADSEFSAAIADARGRVITSSHARVEPGHDLSALEPYVRFLPRQESGAYIGAGSHGAPVVAAFRVSRQWPVLALAETPLAVVHGEWRQTTLVATGMCAAFLALLAALGWSAERGLRREQADQDRQAELHRELAATEERWKLALEGAGHDVWDLDLRSGRALLSPSLRAWLAPPPEGGWTDAWLRQIVHPDDLPAAEEAMQQHLRGRSEQFERELRLRDREQGWRWLLARARKVSVGEGDPQRLRLVGTVTDIQQRKTAELALRKSEALQQAILRNALDGIVSVDAAGRIVGFNPAAERIFGRSAAEVLGQPMDEKIMPHRHRAAHGAGMERYLATGVGPVLNRRIEVEGLRADGEVFPLEMAITPVETDDGLIFTATVRDIGERRRIEQALRDSEALLDKVGQIARIGGWQVDLETTAVQWTDETFRLHDLEPGAVPPLAEALAYYAPEARPRVEAAVGRAIDTGQGFDFEAPIVTARGRTIWVRAQGTAEYAGDRPARIVGTIQDITERRAVESALRESEERFRTMFEQAAVGMVQQDLDRRVVKANEAVCAMLGYSADELRQLPISEVMHPEDLVAGGRNVQRLLAGEQARAVSERRYRHRDGHYLWARVSTSVMRRADGSPDHLLAIVEDVTARREAQDALALARQRELSFGARIQQSLLVQKPAGRLPGLWLSVLNQASQGIDGDFFDVVPLGQDTVDVIVGDVMGKGVAAALLGAATKMQFSRSLAQLMAQPGRGAALPSPAEIVSAVHQAMTPHLQELEAFVTLSYVRLAPRLGRAIWVGCGHEEPWLLRRDGTGCALANQHPPLGILDQTTHEQQSIDLLPGDALLFASDGAADARLPDGDRVGRERVLEIVQRLYATVETPATVLHGLRRALSTLGAQVDDDLTLAMATVVSANDAPARRELPRHMDAIADVRRLVELRARAAGLEEPQAGLFTVACIEAFTNVVRHTRGASEQTPIEVVATLRPDALRVEIISIGDPYAEPVAPEEMALDRYPEGGFGTTIIESASDSVEYIQREGVNVVRLTRNLQPAGL